MSDPIHFNTQPGGVPVQSVLGVIPAASINKAVSLGDTSSQVQSPIAFTAPSPGRPILAASYIDFLQTITDAIQFHKESVQSLKSAEGDILVKLQSNYITRADRQLKIAEDLIAEAKEQIGKVEKIINDVETAYNTFSGAIATYNAAATTIFTNDTNAVNTVNDAITFLNSFSGLSTNDYNARIAQFGGETAVRDLINTAFNQWNNYTLQRNNQLGPLENAVQTAINAWSAALVDANQKLTAINDKRAQEGKPPISLYPDVATTYSAAYTAPIPNSQTLATISGNIGTIRPLVPPRNQPEKGFISVVSFSSLSLSGSPLITDILASEEYLAVVTELKNLATLAASISLIYKAIFDKILDPALQGKKTLLPAAFLDKIDRLHLSAEGSGAGIGQVGRPEFDAVVPVALWKSVFEKAQFPASYRLISTFQMAALDILDKSILAAAIPTASAFGSKLGHISEDSPTFAAVLAVSIADNTLATSASNSARELANILLKNLTGAASAAAIGTPSAGEIAAIATSLSAAFNVALLGSTLAMFQKNLGLPDLAFQVLANVEGVLPADLNGSAVAGTNLDEAAIQKALIARGLSSAEANLAVPIIVTPPVTNEIELVDPGLIQAGKAASDLLDSVLGIKGAEEDTKNRLLQQFQKEREEIASIIKESIQAAIRQGKLDLVIQIKNPVVAELINKNYKLPETLYLANELVNTLINEPPFPIRVPPPVETTNPLTLEELHNKISKKLDEVLVDLNNASAREVRDRTLIALLGGATPKEALDVTHRNPLSVINQISTQISYLEEHTNDAEKEKVHEKLLEVLKAYMTPNAELGFAISTMQDKPTTVLNSISAATQAVAQTDTLTGPA